VTALLIKMGWLRSVSKQAFYNTSPFLLRDLKSRTTPQRLKDDFEAYLDGFSPNVQDILLNFEFRNQIPRLSKADALGSLINKRIHKPSKDKAAVQANPLHGLYEQAVDGKQCSLAQISADILALEEETEGLLGEITNKTLTTGERI
jgi:hypothetical protein